ncbi:hypothetical protein GYMLUDRAFT_327154 [Collybiopsis luxurians FD-317 M1]|nr:hypothetical protein GYMLUDRAFT_327154 [Collybiopsis luxurians FD-317 M1]
MEQLKSWKMFALNGHKVFRVRQLDGPFGIIPPVGGQPAGHGSPTTATHRSSVPAIATPLISVPSISTATLLSTTDTLLSTSSTIVPSTTTTETSIISATLSNSAISQSSINASSSAGSTSKSGTIIGVVVAVIIAVIALIIFGYFILSQRRKRKAAANDLLMFDPFTTGFVPQAEKELPPPPPPKDEQRQTFGTMYGMPGPVSGERGRPTYGTTHYREPYPSATQYPLYQSTMYPNAQISRANRPDGGFSQNSTLAEVVFTYPVSTVDQRLTPNGHLTSPFADPVTVVPSLTFPNPEVESTSDVLPPLRDYDNGADVTSTSRNPATRSSLGASTSPIIPHPPPARVRLGVKRFSAPTRSRDPGVGETTQLR